MNGGYMTTKMKAGSVAEMSLNQAPYKMIEQIFLAANVATPAV